MYSATKINPLDSPTLIRDVRRVLSSRVCVLMRCNVLGTRVIYIFIKASTSFPNRTSFPLGEGVFFNQSYPKYIGLWVIYGTTSQAKRTKHISIGGDREGGMIITPPSIMFTSTFQTRWASSWANQESGLIKVRECAPQNVGGFRQYRLLQFE